KYRDNISGLGQEGTYTLDLLILPIDSKTEEPMFTFEGITLQQIPGAQSGRWALEKSIFDKLNNTIDLPNVGHREYVDSLVKDYCMKQVWNDSLIITSVADLFPSPEKIFNSKIDNNVSNQDLVESMKPFNELAAYYAQLSLKELDLSLVDDQYRPLLNACHLLTSLLCEQVTLHSIQLRLMQLLDRFPRLEPILTLLNAYGSRLKAIFTGEQSGVDVFLGNDDTGRILQQVKNIMSANKTQMIFDAIDQHLRAEYKRNSYGSLSNYRLRICWFATSECSDVFPILDLLLNLSHHTDLWIDLHYANMDTTQLAQAEQIFETRLSDQTRLSIIYDQTLDLFNSETFAKIPIESFDIIFAANQLPRNEDLAESLINLRRLLVPNGLLLLLELIDVPLYFDLILGLLDQWWSPFNNTRALNDIQQWVTVLKQIGGFTTVTPMWSQYESTLIIAQKTMSQEILRTLDERKHQRWLLFARNDVESL
ncbi:unnamed protein product, partial [Adineta steineri]